ncbi:hypothetical protein FOXG_19793 [Fusarium oxysporum f. sp. lycopersici 4287]|uniref:Uncharacterized protein n=2 Tax=Fusarium oxysporum TaxID=5507 RepID=A0A0J9WNA9_FUSO4|nr:hypothetical protein FOXG_19793 [Fusarium oxysporum f. sp. lycopersici 4287]EXK31813.1 hypothetical protein FOMG_12241 [Fusarium oxysporum f. sp. melonis 26406]KNB06962.1 hypothetical protein FOXG_19793 [Fusarium oxysporum f. sp. lycopersici 4287]
MLDITAVAYLHWRTSETCKPRRFRVRAQYGTKLPVQSQISRRFNMACYTGSLGSVWDPV